MKQRTLRPTAPIDLKLTLAPLRHGWGDPTIRFEDAGVWKATRTPQGPATLHLCAHSSVIEASAWGPGAAWALDNVTNLVGYHDRPERLKTSHQALQALRQRFAGLRMGASKTVMEVLIPTILEQRVVRDEARKSYRKLLQEVGEPAPGPGGLVLPADPQQLAALPSYMFHPFGIERRRAELIRRVCLLAHRLEEATMLPWSEARRRLTSIIGIGPWTAAEVARKALGDPDAVRVGDYHLPHVVSWVLAGEARASDERMLELLEPYRGQRGRVARLIEIGGKRPPRRGPRTALRDFASF